MIPEFRGPAEVADAEFHQLGQAFDLSPKHVLEAFRDVFLPCPVDSHAFDAVAVARAAPLRAGAILDEHGTRLRLFGLSGRFHGIDCHSELLNAFWAALKACPP